MHVRVPIARRIVRTMRMLMVLVVHMPMTVLDGLVHMHMRVIFEHVQRDADAHQQSGHTQ